LTQIPFFDLKIYVNAVPTTLTAEQLNEVDEWIGANLAQMPEAVVAFLTLHRKYLTAGHDLRRRFNETLHHLRRALGITASSERRRSGRPLASVPGGPAQRAATAQQRLEQQLDRSNHLEDWHDGLSERHGCRAKRIKEKLAKMKKDPPPAAPAAPTSDEPVEPAAVLSLEDITEDTPVEDIPLTPEQIARSRARGVQFGQHLLMGDGVDPALQSVTETLMPGSTVVSQEEMENLAAHLPADLAGAKVVKTLSDQRVRYDISVAVNPITLNVQKHVVVKPNGERTVVSASTDAFGPPRYSVTWSALATLAVLVGQFALPLNRLATLFSTAGKQFTAGGLSRMLHYVAQRLVPIYLHLAEQLADSNILAGDDTSCRVIEVQSYFTASKANIARAKKKKKAKGPPKPWAAYRTPDEAEASIKRCELLQQQRMRRREDGDRAATRTSDEEPSLGMLIGRVLEFESPRQDGGGAKQSLNTTVVTGRSVAEDPHSLIVFYRSHLGGYGNLLESILGKRNAAARDVILQADLSSTNLVKDPQLLQRFDFKLIGCSAHARRPFALYEHEDRVYCEFMLHLFAGLAMHEERLDVHGRNRVNVLAVRQNESRRIWEQIKELATDVADKWSKGTKLGAGARYILKHYDKLTAYLDDPRLEPTNNLQERMLRTEKLIEKSSMFRRTLEGRFVLDIIRTVLQTAVAAGAPVHEYLESVLRSDADEIVNHPERFTPHAWAARQQAEQSSSSQ
jgi:hypothetical protein